MTLMAQLENMEAMIVKGRVPGTARTLVNQQKISAIIDEIKKHLPDEITEAEGVVRQKDAIIKQAEIEARRIRAYADEEATTIRQLAEEQSNTLLATSQEEAKKMVQDTEIIRKANENANEIDAAMKLGANPPIGPLALADMIGIDVCLYVMNVLLEEFGDSKFRPCPLLKQMVNAGYLGRKSRRGFFDYSK